MLKKNIFNFFNKDLNKYKEKTPLMDFYLRFKKYKIAIPSVYTLIVMALLAIIIPEITPHKFDFVNWNLDSFPDAPSLETGHYLGSDASGRDLLARIFIGVRVSLLIGFSAAIIALCIGLMWGSISGYLGGRVDNIMMRFVDVLSSIPDLLLLIILTTIFGRSLLLMTVFIGCFSWLGLSRVVRGQTLSLKNKEFIEAAKSYSLPTYLIILKHIIPNLLGVISIFMVGLVPSAILFEAALSFLGLGLQEPNTSLGILLSEGAKYIETSSWLFLFPFVAFVIIEMALQFIGYAVRDALDKKSK